MIYKSKTFFACGKSFFALHSEIFANQFCFTNSNPGIGGLDTFDKSRLVMTFLTILGVTEILFCFRLVLEGKTGKEIPKISRLEFLETFLETILLYQMQKTTLPSC